MSSNRNTYQQVTNVSVNRDRLIEIAQDTEYTKKDFRVFLALLAQLDGYSIPKKFNSNHKDPMNFKKIDIDKMSELLCMSKKDVKKSIEHLYNDGYIEKGNNDIIKNGYRFTF